MKITFTLQPADSEDKIGPDHAHGNRLLFKVNNFNLAWYSCFIDFFLQSKQFIALCGLFFTVWVEKKSFVNVNNKLFVLFEKL